MCTLTNDSMITRNKNNHDNVVIITDNHVVAITEKCDVNTFNLPVKYVYHAVNTQVRDLIWSKDLHHKLPNNYKELVRIFMMCNRLMGKLEEQPLWGQFKIPHCVLPIIFSIIIN